jgi:hypothetical protein
MKTKICIAVGDAQLARPVEECLKPLPTTIYVNRRKYIPSFSKMINEIVYDGTRENIDYLIICSHRVRPTLDDIERIVSLLNEGFGFVTLLKLECFGINIELIRNIICFLYENFIPVGYEYDEFLTRLQDFGIGIYEEKSVNFLQDSSLWQQELFDFDDTEEPCRKKHKRF